MVKEITNKEAIIDLWQEAFGDTKEEILFFLENCKNKKCLGYFENGSLLSMLFLVKCSFGYYIYAACTKKQARNTGAMSALLDYCKNSYRHLCLIPANEPLISYYKKRGFIKKAPLSSLEFEETKEICAYLLEGCELKQPFILIYTNNVKGDLP